MGTRWFFGHFFLGKNVCLIWSPCQLAVLIVFQEKIGVFAIPFFPTKIGVFVNHLFFQPKIWRCHRLIDFYNKKMVLTLSPFSCFAENWRCRRLIVLQRNWR
jgi:hypothetical protein